MHSLLGSVARRIGGGRASRSALLSVDAAAVALGGVAHIALRYHEHESRGRASPELPPTRSDRRGRRFGLHRGGRRRAGAAPDRVDGQSRRGDRTRRLARDSSGSAGPGSNYAPGKFLEDRVKEVSPAKAAGIGVVVTGATLGLAKGSRRFRTRFHSPRPSSPGRSGRPPDDRAPRCDRSHLRSRLGRRDGGLDEVGAGRRGHRAGARAGPRRAGGDGQSGIGGAMGIVEPGRSAVAEYGPDPGGHRCGDAALRLGAADPCLRLTARRSGSARSRPSAAGRDRSDQGTAPRCIRPLLAHRIGIRELRGLRVAGVPDRGDCASAAIQYSVLPSSLSLTKVGTGVEQTRMVLDGINARLRDMAPADRPRFLLFGESLGSQVSQEIFRGTGIFGLESSGIDSAIWIGTPNATKWRQEIWGDRSITVAPRSAPAAPICPAACSICTPCRSQSAPRCATSCCRTATTRSRSSAPR